MRDDFSKFYAVTDEKFKSEDFNNNVKKDNQLQTKGIEVGHIFYFGDKYSKPMNCSVDSKDGKKIFVKMGSYGIGVSRLVAAIIEAKFSNEKMKWPREVSPFDVVIIPVINKNDNSNVQKAKILYKSLIEKGIDVLFDDIDENISKKIVNSVSLKEFDKIIEIGPGKGALTKYLFEFSDKLILIEYDTESVDFIKSSYKKHNPNIIKQDFLKYNLKDVLSQTSKNLIIGNFPYNISSQIIFKILENYLLVGNLIGMFQKEVAERIISKPNSKEYGIVSVRTQLLYDVKILFDVSPNVFFPKPRVNSSVISMTRKKDININFDLKLFDRLVKLSFQQRRKKIKNSLKKLDIKENILEDSIFDLSPEQLSVNDFIRLTQKISNETI